MNQKLVRAGNVAWKIGVGLWLVLGFAFAMTGAIHVQGLGWPVIAWGWMFAPACAALVFGIYAAACYIFEDKEP